MRTKAMAANTATTCKSRNGAAHTSSHRERPRTRYNLEGAEPSASPHRRDRGGCARSPPRSRTCHGSRRLRRTGRSAGRRAVSRVEPRLRSSKGLANTRGWTSEAERSRAHRRGLKVRPTVRLCWAVRWVQRSRAWSHRAVEHLRAMPMGVPVARCPRARVALTSTTVCHETTPRVLDRLDELGARHVLMLGSRIDREPRFVMGPGTRHAVGLHGHVHSTTSPTLRAGYARPGRGNRGRGGRRRDAALVPTPYGQASLARCSRRAGAAGPRSGPAWVAKEPRMRTWSSTACARLSTRAS